MRCNGGCSSRGEHSGHAIVRIGVFLGLATGSSLHGNGTEALSAQLLMRSMYSM